MSEKIVRHPSAPILLDEFMDQIKEAGAAGLIGHVSVIVTTPEKSSSNVFSWNVDAGMMAFHVLCLQAEAMTIGNLIPDRESDE